jgi:hypothetical protein
MPYLNLDLDYFDHPKTKRLVGLLGRGSDVLPVRLWCYCGKFHADTGDMTGYSPIELENLIGWWGQPGKAVEALAKLQFLDSTPSGYVVHDWAKINGHISALKERAQAGAAERWRRYKEEKSAQAMLKHCLSNATSNAPTSPSSPKEIKKIENQLNDVGADHLMPAKPDPVTLPETRKRLAKAAKIDLLKDPAAVFFDEARRAYPGSNGGLKAEWANFEAKYRLEMEIVLPLLAPAIQREIENKAALKDAGLFAPQWKNFQTWINKRSWEQEFGKVEGHGTNGSGRGHSGAYESAAQRNARKLRANLGLDASPGSDSAAGGVVLPLLSPGTTGAGNA